MTKPLVGHQSVKTADTRDAHVWRERAAKEASVQTALTAFRTSSVLEAERVRSSNGIGQLLPYIEERPVSPACVEKYDRADLHPVAQKTASDLQDTPARLLDLVIRADEACGGADLIEVTPSSVANALNVSRDAATAAIKALEISGLIRFFDDYSGHSGARPAGVAKA